MDALIGQVYDAALDPSLWPATMRAICAEFGAAAMTIRGLDYASPQVRFSITTGIPAEADAAYRNRYVRTSPSIRYFREHPDLCLVDNHTHTGAARLDQDHFQREFLEGLCGARYTLTACWPTGLAHQAVHASLLRTREQGPADVRLAEGYSTLRPHLQRALQVSERVARADACVGAAESLYEMLTLGIVMISDRGAVVYSNDAARHIMDAQDGIMVDGTGLHALRRSEDARLQRDIDTSISQESVASIEVSVSRKYGARPYGLNLVPLRNSSGRLSSRSVRVIVVISDPERSVASHGCLVHAFGLTPTEARVLALLCEGKATRDIAATLAIAPGTARLHIEHLLKKSGCHRQSDLVRLALTGSASWLLRSGASPLA